MYLNTQCLLGILLASLLSGCVFYPSRAEIPFQMTAALDGVRRLEVQTRNGQIVVHGNRADRQAEFRGVKFAKGTTTEEARTYAEEITIVLERSSTDSELFLVRAEVPSVDFGRSPGASFEISLPYQMALDLQTSNGRLEIESVEGDIRARTSNGSITVTGVEGDLELRSSNGRIILQSAGKDKVKVATSNGNITAKEVAGDAWLETSNGSIDLQAAYLPQAPQVTATTSNGRVRVTLPRRVSAVLDMRTSNGRIQTDFQGSDVQLLETGRNYVRAQLSDGEGAIKLRSSNGSVSCEFVE